MSTITIQKADITTLDLDCIVNAANSGLREGSGVCGAIFAAAGSRELQKACDAYGGCPVGSAVITPGLRLKAKYIIHAVGPIWQGGACGERDRLAGCYRASMKLALENGCRTIAFPLISSGIYGYPKKEAWTVALQAVQAFQKEHGDYTLDVTFAVLSKEMLEMGTSVLDGLESSDDSLGLLKGTPDFPKLKTDFGTVDAIYFHKSDEPFGFLSNWYPSVFVLDGVRYTSVEQYIMSRKCQILGADGLASQVMATDDVATQQLIARNTPKYSETVWNGMRQVVAMRGLVAKFSQNTDLQDEILATMDAYLVECAWKDKVWACGIGLDSDDKKDIRKWKGKNILGFALMEVRSMLRAKKSAS